MIQEKNRRYLLKQLLAEDDRYKDVKIPTDETGQKLLLRALFNVRPAKSVSEEFLAVQNRYLQAELEEKGITELADLTEIEPNLYIWQGDITTLSVDGIVNAANNRMLGCFIPNHTCIDNAIHTFAGVQLRSACQDFMAEQNYLEETGQAKITSAYNLPSSYILHTVGPIIHGALRQEDKDLLASCYQSCLELAVENGLKTLAFCCISTGEFHFPQQEAAEIAVATVKKFQAKHDVKVIFNVFKEEDKKIYEQLLG